MKNPSHPPSKPSKEQGPKPITAKRQKILDSAMAQLRKTRAQMDPKILGKIRSLVESNPKIMKILGVDSVPQEEPKVEPVKETKPAAEVQVSQENSGAEKIDQARNMEVMAKLMALKPSEIENIKAVLLKTQD